MAFEERVLDPVCGTPVDPDVTAATARHRGRTYHFCSQACRVEFLARPDAYPGGQPAA